MKYDAKKFNIEYRARFESLSAKNNIRVWIAQPLNSVYQRIDDFAIHPPPQYSYRDDQENKILHFKFRNIKSLNILMNIRLTAWKDKIELDNTIRISKESFNRYLKNERFLEQSPKIKALTFKLANDKKTVIEKM